MTMRPYVFLGLLACAAPHPETTTPASSPPHITYEPIQKPDKLVVVQLPGTVEPAPDGLVSLAPRVQAQIVRWLVAPGASITRGQALALLDSPEADSLVALVKERRALRDQARARVEAGVSANQELTLAQAELAGLTANLDAVVASMSRTPAGWRWQSPVAGTVQALHCAPGSPITPARVCIDLVAPHETRLKVHVPERFLPELSDPKALFYPDGLATPTAFDSVVWAPALEPASRTRTAWFSPIPDPSTPENALLSGRSGRTALWVRPPDNAFLVPEHALTRIDGHDALFVQGQSSPLSVEVLGRSADGAIVTHPALTTESHIATRGLLELKAAFTIEDAEP